MLSNFMSSFKLTSYDKTAMKYLNKFSTTQHIVTVASLYVVCDVMQRMRNFQKLCTKGRLRKGTTKLAATKAIELIICYL